MRVDSPDDDVRRRGSMLALLVVLLIGFAILLIPLALTSVQPLTSTTAVAVGIFLYGVVLALARRGRVSAGGFLLLGGLTLATLMLLLRSVASASGAMYLFLPVVVAGLIMRPAQI